ncbi:MULTISPECIES: pyridoxamine 5'-phosphate oxidase family protein [Spirulina sp. CCY15215]|uniref:pyridoxamine 5'-phosphate oxidase family protein n=1 Tax=Spirulina sp. CCY15215 TaxID=2767591 RepID=UPI00194FCBD9|nr:pyridoxamine 5'-phosphate oxidase family protein [Spirulina major]
MPRKFTQIAFTPAVKAFQDRYGSREMYARMEESDPENNTIIPKLETFIQARDSFYLGTRNENGWPYIQFRGGPVGFLKVLDEKTLGFADFSGNCQYLTIGNLSVDDRIFLFLMDYANRRRLKIWGRAKVIFDDPETINKLAIPEYNAEVKRGFLIQVEAWDWNCPQHIPHKYSETEVTEIIAPLQARILELEARVKELEKQ